MISKTQNKISAGASLKRINKPMKLKQLKIFIEIAESGSLGKASDKIGIAQPAMSRHIKLLEEEVGTKLFERHARGMQLTEAGDVLLERVLGPVQQLETTIDHVASLESDPRGTVVLGIVPTVSYVLSSKLAIAVGEALPNVSLRIVEGYSGHLLDWLYKGDIDMCLIYGPSTNYHCRTRELLYDELYLVGREGELSEENPITIKELEGKKFVLPSRPHGLRNRLESAANKKGIKLDVKLEADSYRVLKDLVSAGIGYTALPRAAVQKELEQGLFSIAPLVKPKIMRQIIMAQPAGQPDTHATEAVVKLTINTMSDLIVKGDWPAVKARDFHIDDTSLD